MTHVKRILAICLLPSLTFGLGCSQKDLTLDLGGGVTMKLVRIAAGKFTMGSPASQKGRDSDEGPQRQVTIRRAFYMGITEVTQEQWKAVMGTEPWKGKEHSKDGASHAASYVTWHEAAEFCRRLSRLTGKTVRLPTEAEWEYACRAGSTTRFYYGDDDDYSKLGEYAWYDKNAWYVPEKWAHPVGRKKANDWGLYDMHGNVWEWCSDWYDSAYYEHAKNRDPQGPDSGSHRVLRGGSCFGVGPLCHSANRRRGRPGQGWYPSGLRVVSVLSQ